jgi:5-methylthioadenosine/S-adenosylhomocysteine deaminase
MSISTSSTAGFAQLDAGVTTVMDVSQIHHSAEHSDAAIEGLRDAGRRGVFGYFEGWWEGKEHPGGARRIREQYFSSDDQLLSMVMGGEIYMRGLRGDVGDWARARPADRAARGRRPSA